MQTTLQPIWKLFNSHQFTIPSYQREYSWRSQVEAKQLWKDLVEFVDHADTDGGQTLFLGLMAGFKSEPDGNLLHIVDGQQRLITILLLLCAIRDHGISIKNTTPFDDHDRLCIYKNQSAKSVSKDGQFRRISVFYRDGQGALDAIVHGEGGLKSHLASLNGASLSVTLRNISEVYKFFLKMVREKFPKPGREDRDARATEIVDFMSAITHGVQFCVLVTEDEETVGGLFESMNNRGRALNPADLWKNLLSQEGPKENAAEIAEKWDKVFEGVGKSSSNALRFVRTFALAHASFQEIREKKLFDTLKHEGFISRLGGSVRTIDLMIRDLEGLKHMQQDNLPSGAHCELFRDFKSMNPPIAYLPLLLAVDRIEPKETVRLLEGLIDVHLCGRIMGLKPHLIGNHIAELRVALLVSGVEGLRTALKSTIEELAAKALPRFESLRLDGSVASALLVRSLLGRLYWFVENSIERAAGRPSGFHKHYQIEHIFPQGAEADHYNEFMDGVDETTAAALTGNIGNLLLLDGSANAAGGNTRFHIKRKLYRASSAYLNRALVEVIHEGRGTAAARILDGLTVHETWNRDSISIHAADQRRLFERYLKRTY